MLRDVEEDSDEALPLVFKSLQFQFNFYPGSEDSMKFLDTLTEANLETFRSPTIQAILNYKWSLVRKLAFISATIYAFYIVFLFLNTLFDTVGGYTTYTLLGFGIYFICWEMFQMTIRFSDYWTDIWNIFDLFRGLFLLYFCFADLSYAANLEESTDGETVKAYP